MKINKGITLIALIITIIILLILSGITISTLTSDNGLFERAKEAKKNTENAQDKENTILSEYENILNEYSSGSSSTETVNEEKLIDKVNDKTIPIGAYVKYTPDTILTTDSKYTTLISNLGQTYSGSTSNTTTNIAQDTSLNWRVLDVKNGQVRLISDKPTSKTIEFSGYQGYNNEVYLLDSTCSILYNSSLASKVESIKIEDIQDHMSIDYTKIDETNYNKTFTPANHYYANILLEEKQQLGNGTEGKLGISEQNVLIKQDSNQQMDPLTLKYTYWNKTMSHTDFTSAKYYELFISNGSNYPTYWTSSRCVYVSTNHANFGIFQVFSSGEVAAYSLYSSYNYIATHDYTIRPIVTLNSDVKIDENNLGNGNTPSEAYAIK